MHARHSTTLCAMMSVAIAKQMETNKYIIGAKRVIIVDNSWSAMKRKIISEMIH